MLAQSSTTMINMVTPYSATPMRQYTKASQGYVSIKPQIMLLVIPPLSAIWHSLVRQDHKDRILPVLGQIWWRELFFRVIPFRPLQGCSTRVLQCATRWIMFNPILALPRRRKPRRPRVQLFPMQTVTVRSLECRMHLDIHTMTTSGGSLPRGDDVVETRGPHRLQRTRPSKLASPRGDAKGL